MHTIQRTSEADYPVTMEKQNQKSHGERNLYSIEATKSMERTHPRDGDSWVHSAPNLLG